MVPYFLFAGTSEIEGVSGHFVLPFDTSNSPTTVGASVDAVGIALVAIDGKAEIGPDGAALGCSPPVLQIKWLFKPHFPSLVQSIRFSVDVHSLAPWRAQKATASAAVLVP